MKNLFSNWVKSSFCLVFACLLTTLSPLAKADESAELQESAKRVERLFEEGKITEQQALAELKNIETLAIAYRKNSQTSSPVEEIAGTTLMRRAVFPNFSVFGFLLQYVALILAVTLAIGLVVFFYGGSLGLNRAADWLARQGYRSYQSIRQRTSVFHGNAPGVPPTPRAASQPPERYAPPPSQPSAGTRHSGEVPDHLA